MRAVIGFGCAGVFITTESWLNAKALPGERGRVFGSALSGMMAGTGEEHLRSDEGRRRGALRARASQLGAAVRDPPDIAVLPRARRRSRRARGVRRRESEGPTSSCTAGSTSRTW